MNKIYLISLTLITLVLSSCSSSQSISQGKSKTGNGQQALLWQQTAAERDALCYQAFNLAKITIEKQFENAFELKPAVVLDIDETVLDNSPYNGRLLKDNAVYKSSTWKDWTNQANAKFIPGAADFLDYLAQREVKPIFISNRSVDEVETTRENLKKLGFEYPMDSFHFKSSTSSKEGRRNSVSDQNQIILLIGDNLADFHHIFDENKTVEKRKIQVKKMREEFGTRFIVLPNIMYGDWEKAIQNSYPQDPIKAIEAY